MAVVRTVEGLHPAAALQAGNMYAILNEHGVMSSQTFLSRTSYLTDTNIIAAVKAKGLNALDTVEITPNSPKEVVNVSKLLAALLC
jgi:hypothetical protein